MLCWAGWSRTPGQQVEMDRPVALLLSKLPLLCTAVGRRSPRHPTQVLTTASPASCLLDSTRRRSSFLMEVKQELRVYIIKVKMSFRKRRNQTVSWKRDGARD